MLNDSKLSVQSKQVVSEKLDNYKAYCNNCGSDGHLYRNCKLPVLSYGILCFTDEHNILMIQRKDSLSYIEFIRGKYSTIPIPDADVTLNQSDLLLYLLTIISDANNLSDL